MDLLIYVHLASSMIKEYWIYREIVFQEIHLH